MTINQQGENYNRIKVVFLEQGKTFRCFAEQIDKCENSVFRWCLNKVQPSLAIDINRKVLYFDVMSLIYSTN